MNRLIIIISLLFSLVAGAQTAPDLRVGDVLLQPLNCWACALIEAEEESIFSHMGVILAVSPEIQVAEAYGKVRKVGLAEFLAKTEKKQKVLILRFRNDQLSADIQNSASAFQKMFENDFEGSAYDSEFLWNNFDENGDEKFYCSEMISKLFKGFVHIETPIKRMHFSRYRDEWEKYFHGNVPVGKWGNSPADYERSDLFYHVGEL